MSGIATFGSRKVKLKTVKRSLKKGKRLRVTLTLPAPGAAGAGRAGDP